MVKNLKHYKDIMRQRCFENSERLPVLMLPLTLGGFQFTRGERGSPVILMMLLIVRGTTHIVHYTMDGCAQACTVCIARSALAHGLASRAGRCARCKHHAVHYGGSKPQEKKPSYRFLVRSYRQNYSQQNTTNLHTLDACT